MGRSTPSTRARRSASACRPGSSPVSFSARAVERVRGRAQPAAVVVPRPRRCIADYVGTARRYHHTAPISMLYALHAGLGVAARRGPRRRVGAPPRTSAACCRTRCPSSASGSFARRAAACPQLTSVWLPDGVDDAKLRGRAARALRHRGRRRARRARGQGLAHRAHGPFGAGTLGDHAARGIGHARCRNALGDPGRAADNHLGESLHTGAPDASRPAGGGGAGAAHRFEPEGGRGRRSRASSRPIPRSRRA